MKAKNRETQRRRMKGNYTNKEKSKGFITQKGHERAKGRKEKERRN